MSQATLPPALPAPWTPSINDLWTPKDLATFKLYLGGNRETPAPIDKSQGKVYKIDGDIYYSPNCSRNVLKEPRTYYDVEAMVRDHNTNTVSEYLKPSYWTSACTTYLAFMPEFLEVCSPPLTQLSRELPIYRNRLGWFFDAQQILGLNSLEFDLIKVVEQVRDRFHVPKSHNIVDTCISCTGEFSSKKIALAALDRTRGWFAVWVGQLAYTIAVSRLITQDYNRPGEPESWWQYLRKTGLHSEDMISTISMTDFGGFHCQNRVGTFLHLLDAPEEQPSVEFFTYFNVPVFYYWGKNEVVKASSDAELYRLAPLPEQLQDIAGFLVVQPNSENADPMAPWKHHYQKYLEKREERLRTETPKQRSTRLNREANPKLSGIPIYVWFSMLGTLVRMPSDDDSVHGYGANQRLYNSIDNEWDCSTLFGELAPGEEQDMQEAGILIAEPSSMNPNDRSYENMAAGYAELDSTPAFQHAHADVASQPHPDSSIMDVHFQHEAYQAEEGEIVEYQSMVSFSSPPPTVPQHLMAPSSSLIRVPGLTRPTNSGTYVRDAYGQLHLEEYELVDLLMKYSGFRIPLRLPGNVGKCAPAKFVRISKDLGGSYEPDFFESPVATVALAFWEAISDNPPRSPDPETWDLSSQNNDLRNSACLRLFKPVEIPKAVPEPEPHVINPEPRRADKPLKKAPKVPPPPVSTTEMMYVLDFGSLNTVPWRLAVFGLVNMLMSCRLPENLTERGMLQELINRGVRCQTLHLRTGIPPHMPPPIASVPIRLYGYKFTDSDYRSYQAHARALLQHPRIARAAVLSGGILWRIALMFSTSLSTVTNGQIPTIESFYYGSETGNGSYLHDGLHVEEANVLSGLYHIYKTPLHREKLSWFPLFSTWESKNSNPFWTITSEDLFSTALQNWGDLKVNQPLTASRWGHLIRQPSTVRRAHNFISDQSEEFMRLFNRDAAPGPSLGSR